MAIESPSGANLESAVLSVDTANVPELTPLGSLLEGRKMTPPSEVLSFIKAETSFREHDQWAQIEDDIIGLRRYIPQKVESRIPEIASHIPLRVETYLEKLRREMQKGKIESACYGLAELDDRQVAVYAMDYGFFAGSLGVVAGEKFQQASDLAIKRQIPFIGIFSSSGARQQESSPSLFQLIRITHAVSKFRGRAGHNPYIAVFNGQVWGGISASAAPLADLRVALRGTDYGFSGPRVIETYTREPVEEGVQSAEAHARDRNIDVIIDNKEALLEYLAAYLNVTNSKHEKLTSENLPAFKVAETGDTKSRAFTAKGFFPPEKVFYEEPYEDTQELLELESEEDQLYRQYEVLFHSAERQDTQTLVSRVFSDVVNLYNGRIEHSNSASSEISILRYPAIIASIGKIGPQPFLIIGDQPSYQRKGDRIIKIPASPAPADYRYVRRMLEFGKRLGLPVVFLTDTLGAKPTIEAEQAGQSAEIAETILAINEYPEPVMSFVVGALGSGGGLGTTPRGDFFAMLENSMVFVAEPFSATTILYNNSNPSVEDVKRTLCRMRATAKDQLDLGFIDEIIPESKNPNLTAENIYYTLARVIIDLQKQSKRKRLKDRDKKIRGLRGFEINRNGNTQNPADID